MPDRVLIEQIAGELGTDPGLVEKDWHVVQALAGLSRLDIGGAKLIFTGGTCLSKAWGLIQRFSEDVDFKVHVPPETGRPYRRELRSRIETALTGNGFSLVEPRTVGDDGRFVQWKLDYASVFPVLTGLRPHIQVEIAFREPKLPPIERSVRSFVAQAQNDPPEVASIACADPVETAAEKLSALAWRVLSWGTGTERDASMIRHLHDLAALEGHVTDHAAFAALAREFVALDAERGNQDRPKAFGALMAALLDDLRSRRHWIADYGDFIRGVSYARDDRTISLAQAIAALERLIAIIDQAADVS